MISEKVGQEKDGNHGPRQNSTARKYRTDFVPFYLTHEFYW